ncbi:MAG: Hsp20/alpha crystallin family protein [Saezia sp.]
MFLTSALRSSGLRNEFMNGVDDFEKDLSQWFNAFNEFASTDDLEVLIDKDDSLEFSLDVPGVSREELEIHIENRHISIQTKGGACRQYQSAFDLPIEIDSTASEAKLENGVLFLKLARQTKKNAVTRLDICE